MATAVDMSKLSVHKFVMQLDIWLVADGAMFEEHQHWL
jgi:hypothetical protein